MKIGILILLILITSYSQQTVIAKDSNGLIVEIKEKYGGYVIDTCTVVMNYKGKFVLIHKDGTSAWYPASFHSIRIVKKIKNRKQFVKIEKKDSSSYLLPN